MKVKTVEVTVYIADDGKEFDSAEEMAIHQFKCHIQKLMEKENYSSDAAVDFVAYNWHALVTARELVYKDVHKALNTPL